MIMKPGSFNNGTDPKIRVVPFCYDYLLLLSIRRMNQKESQEQIQMMIDDIHYLGQIYFPEIVTLYNTDQDNVYVIALDFKGEERRCKLEEFFKKFSEYLDNYIKNAYLDIIIYRDADIYYNDDKRIEVGELIFKDGVFHDIPLAHDSIDAITSHQFDEPKKVSKLQVSKKTIHCK